MENVATISNYAGFGRRLVAFILDTLIFTVIFGIFAYLLSALGINFLPDTSGLDPEDAMQAMTGGVGNLMGLQLGSTLLYTLYYAFFESNEKQATPGKMAMGLRVTNMNGGRLSFLHALGRNAAKIISQLILMIGYIMAAFTSKKQALHDMIAKTFVIKAEKNNSNK